MKLAILMLAVVAAFGQELVQVKEIDPAALAKLKAADSQLKASMEALKKAQADAVKAAEAKTLAESEAIIASGVSRYEGPCEQGTATGATIYYGGSKKFSRATVNGKFVLVHEGHEGCGISLTGSVTYNAGQGITIK